MGLTLRPEAFRAWVSLCVEGLAAARAEIDALNVFPVPDRDTGTNAYLTFVAGAEAIAAEAPDADLPVLAKAFADGLLTGAKGNCGVILSQFFRAFVAELGDDFDLTGEQVARCFSVAARAGYAAVGRPVEGTILTVAAAAADGAQQGGDDVRKVFASAAAAAREALARTPMQMERLAQAGVVDSGGRALVVVLDATEQRYTGRVPDRPAPFLPTPFASAMGGDTIGDLTEGGPSYEVMFLLEADEDRIPALRSALDGLGDSLVVVGGDRLWNVHVHVDDVGAALEAGIAAGRPYRIAVTHFADQVAEHKHDHGRQRAVVAAVTGTGLVELFREAGADVLDFTRSQPLTADRMRQALRGADADEVVVLPNNTRYRGLFEAAAKELRADGVRVAVIPSLAQVQGLAALAVHDPGLGFDDDVVAMSSAAAGVKHGAITVATEPGMTMVGPCAAGDVLGVVGGEFSFVGQDLCAVACDVVSSLLTPRSEMVTLVRGTGGPDDLAEQVEQFIRSERVDLDVVVYEGGQENYPLFIAVE
ncbi:MAG TPA: DAK2 domain-containing protein [Aeromicrobium sp.]|nr:DAK2 domain-containing protein [Aeromicrobium sp.]HKY59024.1 DAK2 domain-containing protein [Aeromicrobium sp.]